jgi:hypothetical protein
LVVELKFLLNIKYLGKKTSGKAHFFKKWGNFVHDHNVINFLTKLLVLSISKERRNNSSHFLPLDGGG